MGQNFVEKPAAPMPEEHGIRRAQASARQMITLESQPQPIAREE
ncbi:hypothetical protein CFter6_1861 [Collimonas fungivorans]|uniref:Uncharacterized protein n=1 Tax=Collimonas fungivorans TaxID=158899 RepID=A0A127P9X3_9BURK|nr:hypothetical protein CFter6_1861 [Collimonas fungivorans]